MLGSDLPELFDPLCCSGRESGVKVAPDPAKPELVEGDWTMILTKVHNEASVAASRALPAAA